MRKTTPILCGLCLVLSQLVQAQNTPTYAETADWIREKVATFGGVFFIDTGTRHNITVKIISADKCVLRYEVTDAMTDTSLAHLAGTLDRNTITIPLAEVVKVQSGTCTNTSYDCQNIRNVRMQVGSPVIKMERRRDSEDIKTSMEFDTGFWAGLMFGTSRTDNSALADRVVTALENAVGICKAQAPPKKKEPF